jgi:hypothetical protein
MRIARQHTEQSVIACDVCTEHALCSKDNQQKRVLAEHITSNESREFLSSNVGLMLQIFTVSPKLCATGSRFYNGNHKSTFRCSQHSLQKGSGSDYVHTG